MRTEDTEDEGKMNEGKNGDRSKEGRKERWGSVKRRRWRMWKRRKKSKTEKGKEEER